MTRHRELLESDELAAVVPDLPRRRAGDRRPGRCATAARIGGSLCQADPSEDLSAVCTTLERQLRDPRPRRRAGGDDGGVPPRPVRDRGRRRRDADRDPHPGAAAAGPAPTRRSSAGPATGRSSPAGAAVWLDGGGRSPTPGSGWPRSARTPPASRRSPRRCAAGRRPRSCTPRPARSPPASCDPVTDQRGSADYKRHLADELTRRALRRAVARIDQHGRELTCRSR